MTPAPAGSTKILVSVDGKPVIEWPAAVEARPSMSVAPRPRVMSDRLTRHLLKAGPNLFGVRAAHDSAANSRVVELVTPRVPRPLRSEDADRGSGAVYRGGGRRGVLPPASA